MTICESQQPSALAMSSDWLVAHTEGTSATIIPILAPPSLAEASGPGRAILSQDRQVGSTAAFLEVLRQDLSTSEYT